jgi:hypothetical protein
MLRSSTIRTPTRLALLTLLKPGAARHRNSMLGAILGSRATCETVAPALGFEHDGVLLSVGEVGSRPRGQQGPVRSTASYMSDRRLPDPALLVDPAPAGRINTIGGLADVSATGLIQRD